MLRSDYENSDEGEEETLNVQGSTAQVGRWLERTSKIRTAHQLKNADKRIVRPWGGCSSLSQMQTVRAKRRRNVYMLLL